MFCDCAAQKVKLIRIRDCNEHISRFNPCLHLYTVTCSISRKSHNIVLICYLHDLFTASVYNGNIMSLFAKLSYKCISNLSTSYDYDAES